MCDSIPTPDPEYKSLVSYCQCMKIVRSIKVWFDEIRFKTVHFRLEQKSVTTLEHSSHFTGLLREAKTDWTNFIDWYRQLRIVLLIEDKLNYLEQPLPHALVALVGQQVAPEILAAHTAWVKGSKEIQAEQELLQTTRDFHSCKQEEGQSVSSYVLKMKGYIDNLERLGHPVTLGLVVSLILIGLGKEFNGFVQNYNMHSLGKTVNELHAMLKLHEQTFNLPKNNAPHAIRAARVAKEKSLKHNLELVVQGLRASRKLKPGALSLYVGNGQREAVEAIGNFDLSLPSGLVVVLNIFIMRSFNFVSTQSQIPTVSMMIFTGLIVQNQDLDAGGIGNQSMECEYLNEIVMVWELVDSFRSLLCDKKMNIEI
ncbi:hypothetical protein Tco_0025244 [Tanacetum coccineum]